MTAPPQIHALRLFSLSSPGVISLGGIGAAVPSLLSVSCTSSPEVLLAVVSVRLLACCTALPSSTTLVTESVCILVILQTTAVMVESMSIRAMLSDVIVFVVIALLVLLHPVSRRRKRHTTDHLHHLTKMVLVSLIPKHLKGSTDRHHVTGETTLHVGHRFQEPHDLRLVVEIQRLIGRQLPPIGDHPDIP